jgi:alcohol dehydrogenase, propanol-preferring
VRAAVLQSFKPVAESPLSVEDVARPDLPPGHLMLRVHACGACRTDLQIVEGALPVRLPKVIPGHQIVGEVIDGATADFPLGARVGAGWMGGVDGDCPYCKLGLENLCDAPTLTGYTVHGGYAEFATVRADFAFHLPDALEDMNAAPLLCAGVIGFRSIRVAGVEPGDRVGLFGFGASAHLAISVLRALRCEVYVSTRSAIHRELAASLGATWVGSHQAKAPVKLDRAITFGPVGDMVVAALGSVRKGGVVAVNAIHLDHIPQFDYDSLLYGERQVRSVTNFTRADAQDFLRIAADIGLKPRVTVFPLDQVNQALASIEADSIGGAIVVVP